MYSLLSKLITPLLLTLLCGGILLLALIRPYERAKTYFRVAFMDSSGSAGFTETGGLKGLRIVEKDIDTDYSGTTSQEGEAEHLPFGSQIAIIEAKSIGLYVPVYRGSGSELLERGACMPTSAALFGTDGNSVISAHVNTFFADLHKLKPGDTVTVYATYGKFTYTVKEEIAFSETDERYLKPTQESRLTLYTCTASLISDSPDRIGFICEETERAFYQEDAEQPASQEVQP